jgi:hypothetical protein
MAIAIAIPSPTFLPLAPGRPGRGGYGAIVRSGHNSMHEGLGRAAP